MDSAIAPDRHSAATESERVDSLSVLEFESRIVSYTRVGHDCGRELASDFEKVKITDC